MDIGSIASSSSRLLEALERVGVSPGEGLVSSGPSPVPEALARKFEALMEQESSGQGPRTDIPLQQSQGTENVSSIRQEEDFRVDGAGQTQETSPAGLPETEAPLLSPSELYRLQFQVAMLRLQADTGSKVNQQATQGFDSLLRNQS